MPFLPVTLFAEPSFELDFHYRVSNDYRDLPAEAYDVRQRTRGERITFFDQVLGGLFADVSRWEPVARVNQAQALHLVAFSLSGEVPAQPLAARLREGAVRLGDLSRVAPEVKRFESLIRRTVSMLDSKSDDYVRAYRATLTAHEAIAAGAPDTEVAQLEAAQQIWLQECGQLIRLVETNIVESDQGRLREVLHTGAPPERRHDALTLAQLHTVSRRGVEAGRNAVRLVDRISRLGGLRQSPDRFGPGLAMETWSVTAPVMCARAVLVEATVALARGVDDPGWRETVESLFARCFTGPVALQRSHIMDLTRVALHYSLLTGGRHPLAGQPTWSGAASASAPAYLRASADGTLDRRACTDELVRRRQNANILDNVGFADFYRVFRDRGGEDARGYVAWLAYHRSRQRPVVLARWAEQASKDIEDAADNHGAIRVARRSTRAALAEVSTMVPSAPQTSLPRR